MTEKSLKYRRSAEHFKAASSGDDVVIEGWANKAVVDDVGDLMKFDAVDLGRFQKNPIMFFNHDRNLPIGKWTEWKVTEEGLWVKGVLSKSADRVVSYVRDLVSEGILKTLSIGFDPKREEFNKSGGYNEIPEWRLNEVSIVTLPANIEAEFSLGKALGEAESYEKAREAVLKALDDAKKADEKPKEDDKKPDEGQEDPEKAAPVGGEPAKEPNPEDKPEDKPPEGDEKPTDEPPANKSEEEDEEECSKDTKNAFQECVSAKIPKLLEEGKDQEQAVAIAMDMCAQEGKCSLDALTKGDLDFAREVARKSAEAPKKPEETTPEPEKKPEESAQKDIPLPATPVPQPSDDPSNFGSPQMDLMKGQLALLGKISEQLGELNRNVLALASALENRSSAGQNVNSASFQEPPKANPSDESQKDLAQIAEIRGRIQSAVKDLGL